MKFKKNKGLTLLEVIISLAILGIIIAPILTMTLTTVKISKNSEEKIFATSLAQQCTEYIKSAVIINDSFLGALQWEVGLKKISSLESAEENTEDNAKFKALKEIFKAEGIEKSYLYKGTGKEKYKNIITTIEYQTISDATIDEYSDIDNYDMAIDIGDVVVIKSIENNMELYRSVTLDESKGSINIEVKNIDTKLICTIKQGNTVLNNNIEVIKQGVGDVKFILKGTKRINFNIRAENEAPSNAFNIDFIKEVKSKHTYSMLTGDSSNIKTNYKTFDKSANTPDKLVRKNTFKIQIWNCDLKNKTKNLLQEIKTTKVM